MSPKTKLQPGQTVLAFGSPFGVLRFSVTRGIVSAVNRAAPFSTDARTPGSPAANAGLKNGDVIQKLNGTTIDNGGTLQLDVAQLTPGTYIQLGILRNGTPQTVSVTLAEYAKDGEQVAANDGAADGGKGGRLGLGMADLTADVRQQLNVPDSVMGAAIQSVRPGSAAEDAGLQPGDVIVEVNRQATDSASSVVNSVKVVPNGKDVLLLVWSGGGEGYRVLHPNAG